MTNCKSKLCSTCKYSYFLRLCFWSQNKYYNSKSFICRLLIKRHGLLWKRAQSTCIVTSITLRHAARNNSGVFRHSVCKNKLKKNQLIFNTSRYIPRKEKESVKHPRVMREKNTCAILLLAFFCDVAIQYGDRRGENKKPWRFILEQERFCARRIVF